MALSMSVIMSIHSTMSDYLEFRVWVGNASENFLWFGLEVNFINFFILSYCSLYFTTSLTLLGKGIKAKHFYWLMYSFFKPSDTLSFFFFSPFFRISIRFVIDSLNNSLDKYMNRQNHNIDDMKWNKREKTKELKDKIKGLKKGKVFCPYIEFLRSCDSMKGGILSTQSWASMISCACWAIEWVALLVSRPFYKFEMNWLLSLKKKGYYLFI